MATEADINREQFSIADVFKLVNFAIGPYFSDTKATVVDDNGENTQVPLTDFVLRSVAEEMKERWTGDQDNDNKVVEFAIQNGHYEDYVVPTGEMGGLKLKPVNVDLKAFREAYGKWLPVWNLHAAPSAGRRRKTKRRARKTRRHK